ncbi:hypothetical protein [Sneathia sanguinegens]|uniref:hypothetical protein n=1 Tax=Sneathia sanguinegens TaxID=40543 RepID=UPI0023F701E2|nr:hypothetical protein [Sneathia sanguinegens]
MKEKRNLKISYSKCGTGIGAILRVPIPLLKELGITQEEREIELILDREQKALLIKKR